MDGEDPPRIGTRLEAFVVARQCGLGNCSGGGSSGHKLSTVAGLVRVCLCVLQEGVYVCLVFGSILVMLMGSQGVWGFLAVTCSIALADETPLQDFCVADLNSPVFVNGFACKDPKLVQLDDFFFSGLSKAGNTSNALGSEVTHGFVTNFPALNTLGIGIARIDFAPHGLNPPHYHPRASEILTVIEGTLLAGFVTSNPENRLFAKVLEKGESVVYPEALLHFQQNVGNGNAVALAVFNSQNPDVNTIANSVFGSNPAISSDILAKAFQVSKSVIDDIKSKF
ncbi:hypothetical protein RHMOL_Rhmol13G0158100 [Rhododendron molle]|uniref:Uncharacterized protein n=1 Tax=Rhododendron molle TaxID=49168 RepID=A0ACC0L7Q4_RHOML|nr:hypothetical protein RHMOL_Rhmol13G0158100 [Rhododendron molle]